MTAAVASQIFAGALADATPEELLEHFRTRTGVRYFAIPDAGEIARHKIDNLVAGRFEFLNQTYNLGTEFDWKANPSADIEWLILLHKFYYSVGLGIAYQETRESRYAQKWIELTSTWIDSIPVDFLPSDVAGRRIQNWIFAYRYFLSECQAPEISADFHATFLASLFEQALHLRHHLTPARNHRTLELWALFLTAVVFPEFREATEWLEFSRVELARNIQEDLLPDGVQCELSTFYHHVVLRNYIAVRRLSRMNGIAMPQGFDTNVRKALDFAKWAHTPAGIVPALSDGDRAGFRELLLQGYEIYGDPELEFAGTGGMRGTAPAQNARVFSDSGYCIVRSGWSGVDDQHLIFDCGPLGAGNHGHLDALSFELAAFGRSLVVDPGRYTYDESGPVNWRVLFRGTSYHNTVAVDGRNQTRYAFHKRKFKVLGAAPVCELRTFGSTGAFDFVHAVARSSEYPVVHERQIVFVRPEYWVIVDRLFADEEHDYDLRFHLTAEALGKVTVHAGGVFAPHLLLAFAGSYGVAIETGYVSSTYGLKEAAPVIRFSQRASSASFYTVLYPFGEVMPEIRMERGDAGYWIRATGGRDLFLPDSGEVIRRSAP